MPKANRGLVGDRVIRNFRFLYVLCKTRSQKKRWEIVQNATRDELGAIVDVCKNVFTQNFKLTKTQLNRLEKHMANIKKASKSQSSEAARAIIQRGEGVLLNPKAKRQRDRLKVVQRGGALPALLIPVLIEAAATIAEKGIDHFFPAK